MLRLIQIAILLFGYHTQIISLDDFKHPNWYPWLCNYIITGYPKSKNYPDIRWARKFNIDVDSLRAKLDFNEKCQEYIQTEMELYPETHYIYQNYAVLLNHTENIHNILFNLYEINVYNLRPLDIRYRLNELKKIMGPQAFYNGYIPPAAPVWYFRRID